MNTISWMDCILAVHLLCPDTATRTKMLGAISQSLALEDDITMTDGSPMTINDSAIDRTRDAIRQGQITVSAHYGVIKRPAKPHNITRIDSDATDQHIAGGTYGNQNYYGRH